ncbi:hypothetical protein GCM10010172_32160 [Paractinoplanes ferrugineus]|uniref:Uncharacterized protein n=1 Tax=Paractinoplanes ferrugineus TaxID=113564 RepID=A0A919J691_9ACTN|nr:hypothetical protein [Actinoplanes ferrugineus]GIE14092.1 hypothetical protein Afe05nite_59320 [Actinoplanes ferrugineus]
MAARSEGYKVGDLVTVLPPYDRDPYILNFQHYGRIAAVQHNDNQSSYMVELDSTLPPRRRVGPFPAGRLAKGWRDQSGRWLVE